MNGLFEVVVVVALVGAVALLISRFPNTRKAFGAELDDALYRSAVRSVWLGVAIMAIAIGALWLLL